MTDTISAPQPGEYADYYQSYIDHVPDGPFLESFAAQPTQLRQLLDDLPPGEDRKQHAPYTWTLRQVVGHLIDVERIFSTRMLIVGVGDTTPIPGMDQNDYVAGLNYEDVELSSLLDEFAALRTANVLLASRMEDSSFAHIGTASDCRVSARALLYILSGHVEYHAAIMKKRVGAERPDGGDCE